MYIRLKGTIMEDFTNYKEPSMFLITSVCDFKCCREANNNICQNSDLIKQPTLQIRIDNLYKSYINNPITSSIVIGGLEPFDQWDEIFDFINYFRIVKGNKDPIIIYTGYYPNEIDGYVQFLKLFDNIIIKFGRFIPNQKHKYDEILGVELASDNQFAIKIS